MGLRSRDDRLSTVFEAGAPQTNAYLDLEIEDEGLSASEKFISRILIAKENQICLLGFTEPFQGSECPLRAGALKHRSHLGHFLTHDFTHLKFHRSPLRNIVAAAGLIGVTAHARFGQAYFKYAEIAQFHVVPFGERFRDKVERFLDDIENLGLNHPCLVADPYNQIPFRQIRHSTCKNSSASWF